MLGAPVRIQQRLLWGERRRGLRWRRRQIHIDRIRENPRGGVRCVAPANFDPIGARLGNRELGLRTRGLEHGCAVPENDDGRVREARQAHEHRCGTVSGKRLPHRCDAARPFRSDLDPACGRLAVDHRIRPSGAQGLEQCRAVSDGIAGRCVPQHGPDREGFERRVIRRDAGNAAAAAVKRGSTHSAMRIEPGERGHRPLRGCGVPPAEGRNRTVQHGGERGSGADPIPERGADERRPRTAAPRTVGVQPLDAVSRDVPVAPRQLLPGGVRVRDDPEPAQAANIFGHRRGLAAEAIRRLRQPDSQVVAGVGADLNGVQTEHAAGIRRRYRGTRRISVIGEHDELEASAGRGRGNRGAGRRAVGIRAMDVDGAGEGSPAKLRVRRALGVFRRTGNGDDPPNDNGGHQGRRHPHRCAHRHRVARSGSALIRPPSITGRRRRGAPRPCPSSPR